MICGRNTLRLLGAMCFCPAIMSIVNPSNPVHPVRLLFHVHYLSGFFPSPCPNTRGRVARFNNGVTAFISTIEKLTPSG